MTASPLLYQEQAHRSPESPSDTKPCALSLGNGHAVKNAAASLGGQILRRHLINKWLGAAWARVQVMHLRHRFT